MLWRFTQVASGHVAIVMCGVNRARSGERWAFVGLAAHPGGFFRWAVLQDAHADLAGYGVRAVAGARVLSLDGAGAYAEKSWGADIASRSRVPPSRARHTR